MRHHRGSTSSRTRACPPGTSIHHGPASRVRASASAPASRARGRAACALHFTACTPSLCMETLPALFSRSLRLLAALLLAALLLAALLLAALLLGHFSLSSSGC